MLVFYASVVKTGTIFYYRVKFRTITVYSHGIDITELLPFTVTGLTAELLYPCVDDTELLYCNPYDKWDSEIMELRHFNYFWWDSEGP